MKTFKRICIKDYEITADNGDKFKIKRGVEYITSAVNQSPAIGPKAEWNHVIVFDDFWVPIPFEMFAGEVEFTKV
jgi:hypothetical protein